MRFLIALILLSIFTGCSSSIDIETVELRTDGLTYYKGTSKLVDGTVTRKFENGRLAEKVTYESGKQLGKWFSYDYDGNYVTHGYGVELDQQIISTNEKLNLSNTTLSIHNEGDYRSASIALRDDLPEVTIRQLLQFRNSIFALYSGKHQFKDVDIYYKSNQYRFLNLDYSSNISLDTTKSNDRLIINVR
jgi:hypothetical protein